MPSHESIVAQEIERSVERLASGADEVRAKFSAIFSVAQSEALRAYALHQLVSGDRVLADCIVSKGRDNLFAELANFFTEVRRARKAFRIVAFEATAQSLFRRCGLPFEEFSTTDGIRSFVMPSMDDFNAFSGECIIFAASGAFNEFWAQFIVRETQNATIFLALPRNEVGLVQLERLQKLPINVLVTSSVKEDVDPHWCFPKLTTFEDFFEVNVSPVLKRWEKRRNQSRAKLSAA
ncbi:MAG TPA: hypothetical protein VEF03_00700 [Candidatus Binataceae bacterium]|nr:hypothetical protein [Candidatus Binataceae bacterium]